MKLEHNPWPTELAQHYRDKGYWRDEPLTRGLDWQRRHRPDAIGLICGNRQFRYADIDGLSSNLAARLSANGLGHGDTALVQLPNVAEFYLVFLALLKIGVAPVNALFSHRKLELSGYAQQLQPRLLIAARRHELFASEDFIAELTGISPHLSQVLLLDETAPERSLAHWLETPPLGAVPIYFPTPADQVAFFQLSGGSTGVPKLIPRTHNDYDYSVRASADICGLGPHTRFLCALPAPHNFVLSSPGALGVFHAGGCVVMAPSPEPQTCFQIIERRGVTMAALVPPAVMLWLQVAERTPGAPLRSLEVLQVGGACFAESLARRVPATLGCTLQQVFGMAEGLVNYTRLDDDPERVFTTQGRPISPDDEIRIVDDQRREVADGETGMLATRGPYTFRGYYRSPEHNARVFDAQGFYYSGDLVQRTPEGYLRVVGRVKDQINRGGEKIAAEEIESLLLRHPAVTHAALVAMDDALMGEKSCAFLVTNTTDLRPATLRRHLLDLGVAAYKVPDRFRFIDAMPLTAVGKIDKRRLRNELALRSAPAANPSEVTS
ncbi:(2,3-dihydroxybenzoyl)adenylate synthase [Billgrantia endophytica]|uniref:2,3-dihydroxybenzoate-AMP ligase n=1 Tax=Billgrantia endophytica TaxID=2033802 RepID=A0A2N7TZJ4_9GAMM|nr:(2,3-dihydroxybenzoyl)adenylate synthase [Halomonas endophytica]PMR73606.1 2,3-dihydroxybenzoate-AMP ligase [Halomonas endophytica]